MLDEGHLHHEGHIHRLQSSTWMQSIWRLTAYFIRGVSTQSSSRFGCLQNPPENQHFEQPLTATNLVLAHYFLNLMAIFFQPSPVCDQWADRWLTHKYDDTKIQLVLAKKDPRQTLNTADGSSSRNNLRKKEDGCKDENLFGWSNIYAWINAMIRPQAALHTE